ncbi:MAG TPA: helix-turn-helix domain-containing protein [Puia sp.]|jgi:excisionase family DNA binding protein|nr:helix-turn-helix domain-containing protein [Puia sp.]
MTEKIIFFTEPELRKLIADLLRQCNPENSIQKDILNVQDANWITRKEAAGYLNISLPTLDKYTRQYDIPVCRVGRQKRYKKTALDQVMAKHQIKYKIK